MARRNIKMQGDSNAVTEVRAVPVAQGNDYSEVSWTELRKMASDRGVVSWRRTRLEIESDLVAQDKEG